MSVQFSLGKAALLAAAATVSLFAAPQLAAAQPSQPVPYAGDAQGPDYGPPPPPPGYGGDARQGSDYAPPPPPPPPPPGAYMQGGDDRYAGPNGDQGYREPRRGRCQMVEDRVLFPDGTSDSQSVRACRDREGHWRVVDIGPRDRD